MKSCRLYLLLLILAVAASSAVLIGTRWGIGASPDSVFYLGAARNLLAGRGYSLPSIEGGDTPLTHLPPFYSAVLAALAITGLDIGQAARGLNAALFGVGLVLVGVLISRWLPVAMRWLALAGAFILFASPGLLEIHLMAWSEPLFLFVGILGLVLLGRYLHHPRLNLLVVSSSLIGLALLTRYAGAALVATVMLGLLVFSSHPWRRRFFDSLLFGLVSLLPMAFWLLRNLLLAGTAAGRQAAFHPVLRAHLIQAVNTLASWLFIPAGTPGLIKLGVVGVMVVGIMAGLLYPFRRRFPNPAGGTTIHKLPGEIRLLVLFSLMYPLFLLFTISFIDANTPLDGRILSPSFVCGVMLAFFVLSRVFTVSIGKQWLKMLTGAIVLSFCAVSLWQSAGILQRAYFYGIGFNSVAWHQSATLEGLKRLPDNLIIYTNAPDGVFFHTQRAAIGLPSKFDSLNRRTNPNYEHQMAVLEDRVKGSGAVIVYFDQVDRPNMADRQELTARLPLRILAEYNDGVIYSASTP